VTRAYLGGNVYATWSGEKLKLSTESREGLTRWIELDASQVRALQKQIEMLARYSPQMKEAVACEP
jgi:hypothetical protein